MSDKMRWRYGDTNPVVAAVDSATVIEIGDLVWQDTDDAKPASSLADQGTETANQEALGRRVPRRGHAAEPQRRDRADPRGHHRRVRVRLPERHVRAGRPGRRRRERRRQRPVESAGGEGRRKPATRSAASPSGRPAATTSVLVDIRSTVMTGGVEGGSPSGV